MQPANYSSTHVVYNIFRLEGKKQSIAVYPSCVGPCVWVQRSLIIVSIKMMFKLTEIKQSDCTHSCMCRSIPSEHLIDNAVMKHKHPSCWCYSLAVSHSTVCKLFPMLRILVYQLIPTCTQLNTSTVVSRKYTTPPSCNL